MVRVLSPNQLNIEIQALDGPNETPFYLPQPSPLGLKVLQLGGWSKADALAAHILAGQEMEILTTAPPQFRISERQVEFARLKGEAIIAALAPKQAPEPEEPKPLIIGDLQDA